MHISSTYLRNCASLELHPSKGQVLLPVVILLPTAEAEKIKPKGAAALGEAPRARRGAKVNFTQ
jgi:hypothetical protein